MNKDETKHDDTLDEYLDPVGNDEMEIRDTPDGGAEIVVEDEAEVPAVSSEHFGNLASTMQPSELKAIADELIDLVEKDGETRAKRDQEYAKGIQRTGITDNEDEDKNEVAFDNGAVVRHPMLIEACVDFSAKVMKEIFPASGPVKDHIVGTPNKERTERAKRKKRFMNWQVTRKMREFRTELEQAITQLPMTGGQYLKINWDARRKRPRAEFVPEDKVWLPYAASSYWSADRKTHVMMKTEAEIKRNVKDGLYVDTDLTLSDDPQETKPDEVSHKVDGISDTGENVDGARTLYEVQCYWMMEGDEEEKPYIITIDQTSRSVMSIYRNWSEDDETAEPLAHMVQFPFIFWRGAYPIGLNHLIGNLNSAATGALRALLDSAHVNNMPTALKLEGGSKGAQTIDVSPGTINQIAGAHQVDDIRKTIMPMPFNPPSNTLFQLLEWLSNTGRGVVRTTFEDLADQKTDMPVGTTMALIDQGLTVFSSIYSRIHAAMGEVFDILQRLNRDHLSEEKIVDDLGEVIVRREDFEMTHDVALVSNPMIFSEVQRQAQIALIAQRAAMFPTLYNLRKVEEKILEGSRIDNPKELLVPMVEPKKLNAVNENLAVTMGRALVVFPEQDHISHIKTHLGYLQSPLLGGGAHMQSIITAPMLQHLKDHLGFWYLSEVYRISSEAAGVEVDKLIDDSDDEVTQKFDQMMETASARAIEAISAHPDAASFPPVIQQLVQLMQQLSQSQVQDPKLAVQQAEVQRKTAADQQSFQLKQAEMQQNAALQQQTAQQNAQRLQLDAQNAQEQNRLKQGDLAVKQQGIATQNEIAARNEKNEMLRQQMQEEGEQERSIRENDTKYQINREDNEVALTIADMEIESGENVALSNGNGIGE